MSRFPYSLIVAFLIIATSQIYNFTEARSSWEEVFWEDVNNLEYNTTVLLVDVRQPLELEQTGIIPGAINIPLNNLEVKLTLPSQNFLEEFQRDKPQKDTPIIFYCRSGVRSTEASNVALDLGFTNVKNYRGSWLDWEQHLNQNNYVIKKLI